MLAEERAPLPFPAALLLPSVASIKGNHHPPSLQKVLLYVQRDNLHPWDLRRQQEVREDRHSRVLQNPFYVWLPGTTTYKPPPDGLYYGVVRAH